MAEYSDEPVLDFGGEGSVWECFICATEFDIEIVSGGWVSNYHPLCYYCADSVFYDPKSPYHDRLTYHHSTGDFAWLVNKPTGDHAVGY